MALLALLVVVLAALDVPAAPPVATTSVLLLAATLSDLVALRLHPRPGGRISLLPASAVVAVLLVEPPVAVLVVTGAALLSSLLRRRPAKKLLMEVSGAALVTEVLAGVTTLVSVGTHVTESFGPGALGTPTLALVPFIAANLGVVASLGVTLVLNALLDRARGLDAFENLRLNAVPSLVAALATAFLGSLVVVLTLVAPFLLPLAALPAWAATRMVQSSFSDRAEQARRSRASEVTTLLTGGLEPDALVTTFLSQARDLTGASWAVLVRDIDSSVEHVGDEPASWPLAPGAVARLTSTSSPVLLRTGLPAGWSSALTAPLEVDGHRVGTVVLASSQHAPGDLDPVLWSSLVRSLESALDNALLFRQLRAITTSQGEAVIALDPIGALTFLNPAAEKMLGCTYLEVKDQPLDGFLRTSLSTRPLVDVAALVLDGSSRRYNRATLVLADREVPVDATVTPMTDPLDPSGPAGTVLVLRDITEHLRAERELAQSQEQVLELGRALQATLLPPVLPDLAHVSLSARYHAASGGLDIGGDFYDVLTNADGTANLVMGDVCGRGPRAAALTSLTRHTLRGAVSVDPSPDEALLRLNEAMAAGSDGSFCTVVMARTTLAPGRAEVEVSCGGHPPALVVRASGEVERVGSPGTLLGAFEEVEVGLERVELGSGDVLVLYTDGVLEARSDSGDFFEDGPLDLVMASCAGLDAEEVAKRLDAALVSFQGGVVSDDTAFLVMSVS
jgi:sigma-B regulation protein RsbU (phosphoserine phosphatase)